MRKQYLMPATQVENVALEIMIMNSVSSSDGPATAPGSDPGSGELD